MPKHEFGILHILREIYGTMHKNSYMLRLKIS